MLQSSTVQSLRSRCFPHVRLQDRQQRDKTTPCPNTHRPRNSKEDLRFLRYYVAKEGGRIQSGHSSFPFRFDRVRDTDCETLTCHVHARRYTALCFQPLLFPHVWWRELKDTITARFFGKRRRADRQHEVPSVWVSIVCETRIAKLPPVTCMRRCYSVQR